LGLKDLLKFRGDERKSLAVQTARRDGHPFGGWMNYTPLAPPDIGLLDAMREGIPIIDAALDKIVRLTGSFDMNCSDPLLQDKLNRFVSSVRVGPASQGLHQFVNIYLHSLIAYGNAVGEIVPTADGEGIYALYNARLRDVHIRRGDGPLDAQLCTFEGMKPVPVRYPALVLFTPLNPPAGEVRGQPLLSSLPFVSDILMKIFASVGQNFERMGNLRYAVTYKPGGDRVDKAQAKDIAQGISKEWSAVMGSSQKGGPVQDFVAVGDVDIKVIGADNQMLNSAVPVRQMLEQIIAKLGIPPFMLGLSWATTERMSAQQADILTSELESYRRLLNPVLTKICDTFLRLGGHSATTTPIWNDINLQDEVETAGIRLTNARALALEAAAQNKGRS